MNLQQLQMDLQATNIELSKTYEYLQNYNALNDLVDTGCF